MEIPETLKPNK